MCLHGAYVRVCESWAKDILETVRSGKSHLNPLGFMVLKGRAAFLLSWEIIL